MTGTEMIDAIAHIDEDLIDGCVARMKARSSETVALHAKEEIREKTKKPLPAFAKAAIAFGALAAVLLLSFALISLLHIGGKSPTPIGPVSTQTPAPTEAGNEDGESPFRYSVAVVLDNEESLKFKTYGAEDFPEADAIEVVNVSEALEKSIRELVENGVNNEDVKEYNKCLRIVLKDPCEENASACASRLRERDHVVSAEPYLEPYDVTIEGLRCSIAETILNAVGKITVADRVFLYPRSFYIEVTNEEDGRVYDLSYAYKNGMMTYDGLSELYRIHVEYMIRKFGYTEETYKKEAFVHYAFIGSCEIGFAHEETGEIEVKDVAGSKFIFVHPFTIVVQKIGEEDILDITEAYEAGLLTEEDVAEAASLHREFVISTFDFGEKLYEELAAEPTEAPTPVDTFAKEILSVPVKWYSYDELSASPELGEEMTYLESIEDMEMVHYSPEAFCVTDDGEIAIVDTIGARLCVYDLASGQLTRSAKVGEILETPPIRAAKYDGVYYVLIPYSNSRIVAVYPDGTTSEIPVPQLQGMLEYCHVSEYYAEDGRLILTLIGPDFIMTKAVSLSDGSVTSLYSTQWTLENDTFTVTRNGMRWSFPAEPSSGVRSSRIDVLKVGENGELYVIQEVPIEGQDDMGLYQIYDKEGRLLRCEKIDYFMDSYMTADGGRIVGPDDYLYEMHCDEDAVRIIRIVPAEPTAGTEPTEVPTPEPAEASLRYEDREKLAEFFEIADESGVKNGEKLFDRYDPNDPETWTSELHSSIFVCDDEGRLTSFILFSNDPELYPGGEVVLAGTLKLSGFPELRRVALSSSIVLDGLTVTDCPSMDKLFIYGTVGWANISCAFPDGGFNVKTPSLGGFTVNFDGYAPIDRTDFTIPDKLSVTLNAEQGGGVCLRGGVDDELGEFRIELCTIPDEGFRFGGWYDEFANPYSLDEVIDVTFAEPPANGEFVLTALFNRLDEGFASYDGAPPEASSIIATIGTDETTTADIDFDGVAETIGLIRTKRGCKLTIESITFGDFEYDFDYDIPVFGPRADDCLLRILDCDVSDSRLDLLLTTMDQDDFCYLHAVRVSSTGEILVIEPPVWLGLVTDNEEYGQIDGDFDATLGIPCMIYTEILDTQTLAARMTITDEGFKRLTPYSFMDPETPGYHGFRELKRDMQAFFFEGGQLGTGGTTTLRAGTKIAPYQTDARSYIILITEDGKLYQAALELRGIGVYINGVLQDEYCDIWVAG